jgi:hypothetical protein
MKKYKNKQGGLVKLIILVIIAIAILSYYGVDIKEFVNSPQVQKNFGYVWNFVKGVWADYLAEPASKVWSLWLGYVWEPLMNILNK